MTDEIASDDELQAGFIIDNAEEIRKLLDETYEMEEKQRAEREVEKVRWDEEQSDELTTLALGTKDWRSEATTLSV